MCLLFFPFRRRLLTQLEAAKGSRGTAAGDPKQTASAKGPDGVVLYELHSRPEQEKFNESAKVKWKERLMNVPDERAIKCFGAAMRLGVFLFSYETNVRIFDVMNETKAGRHVRGCLCVCPVGCSSLPAMCCLVSSL